MKTDSTVSRSSLGAERTQMCVHHLSTFMSYPCTVSVEDPQLIKDMKGLFNSILSETAHRVSCLNTLLIIGNM